MGILGMGLLFLGSLALIKLFHYQSNFLISVIFARLEAQGTRLCTLSKIRKYLNERTAITIYKSIIMSNLQYGLVFTGNATCRDQH